MHQWGINWPYISGGGLKHNYQLVQFHIHWSQMNENGSEHTINGKHYPAEIHLLHIKAGQSMNDSLHQKDGIAVVSLLLNIGFNPTPLASLDGALRTVLLPFNKGRPATVLAFRPHSLLPLNTESFYRYEGSLTTPGCEESVIWTILSEPVSVTNIQLALLRGIRLSVGSEIKDNTRPIQPLNGRSILFHSSKKHFFNFCDPANPLVKAFGQKFCQFK
uniref:Carbonic anhydrase n=2 Tax=Panagrolaimus sp. PS1159 TaxID=55785 RepID=A0AC35G3C4_9BILA